MADSNKTVYAAMGANFTISIAQFVAVAAAFTGSSSMVAEGIHSSVDTANNGLLLLGAKPVGAIRTTPIPSAMGWSCFSGP